MTAQEAQDLVEKYEDKRRWKKKTLDLRMSFPKKLRRPAINVVLFIVTFVETISVVGHEIVKTNVRDLQGGSKLTE